MESGQNNAYEDKTVKTCFICGGIICGKSEKDAITFPGRGHICISCIDRVKMAQDRQLRRIATNTSGSTIQYDAEGCIPADNISKDDVLLDLEAVTVPAPREIYSRLCDYVCGQQEAKKALAAAVYNHYKMTQMNNEYMQKSNILMIGDTGTGKTYTVKTLAEILGLPCVCVSATSMTKTGWKGDDVEKCVEQLLDSCGGNVKLAEQGIIFIDEIDKLSATGNSGGEYVVGRDGVQQALLKLIEGTEVEVSFKKNNRTQYMKVNTHNILFICGGAFAGLDNIVRRRIAKGNTVGFGASITDFKQQDWINQITNEDLCEYGMMEELLGRLPNVVTFGTVTRELLAEVLEVPKGNILWQYRKIFEPDGIELEFDDAVKNYIVDRAYNQNLGCRGLRRVCEEVLRNLMYELPGQVKGRVIVGMKYVQSSDVKDLIIEAA